MPREYVCYLIQSPLDEIWAKTLSFWKEKKGMIKEQSISVNTYARDMKIKTGTRMRIYGYSFGELYEMHFGYDTLQKLTYVIVEIDYSALGGRGFFWKLPRETIEEWAEIMGIQPNRFENKPSKTYFDFQTMINQFGHFQENPNEKICQTCGAKNSGLEKFCIQCGSKI